LKFKTYLPGLVFLVTLVAVGYVIESGLMTGLLSEDWIDREVRGKGIPGELLFLAVGGLVMAVAVPRHIVSFLGGYAFGLGLGTALALVATEVGCALVFFYGRIVGRPLVSERLRARVHRIEEFLAANPFSMTLLIRLLPVGNNFATCLAAGVSRVPARPFLLGGEGLHLYDQRRIPRAFTVHSPAYSFGLIRADHAWELGAPRSPQTASHVDPAIPC